MTERYVALGSSMAAGPGIRPTAEGSPRRALRSARNYAHFVSASLGLDLVDVTYSGATTANVLREPQHGSPPQISALRGTESLVTVTVGGNDVGYVPLLLAACAPRWAHRLPVIGPRMSAMLDRETRDQTLDEVANALREVARTVRHLAPRARVVLVDYLTLLPPEGVDAKPLSTEDADLGRHVAAVLETLTAEAAIANGCEIVRAGQASRAHHAWSAEPWTTRLTVPLPGRPAPFHPTEAGMRAVAEMVVGAPLHP
jgi:lysophospholipase L1-like esterase